MYSAVQFSDPVATQSLVVEAIKSFEARKTPLAVEQMAVWEQRYQEETNERSMSFDFQSQTCCFTPHRACRCGPLHRKAH